MATEPVKESLPSRLSAQESTRYKWNTPEYFAEQVFFYVLIKGGDGNPFKSIANKWFVEVATPRIRELMEAYALAQSAEQQKEIDKLKRDLGFAEKDLIRSSCTTCGGSGWFADSTEGGIERKCHCWANLVGKLEAELQLVRRELESAELQRNVSHLAFQSVSGKLEAAEQRLQQLAEYAKHEPYCVISNCEGTYCTYGLDKVLPSAPEKKSK